MRHIFLVDDDADVLFAGSLLLRKAGYRVSTESNPEVLLRKLQADAADAVLLDMNFRGGMASGNEGLYWLGEIKKLFPALPVAMVTAYGDIPLAVQALKRGAADFVLKPWTNEQLLALVETLIDGIPTQKKAKPSAALPELIGVSEAMQRVREQIQKVAPTDASVLFTGENGTGKDVAARLLHALSSRNAQPYIVADMGAIPDTLFESELFGYKRGAFTDAREDKAGKFELANGGTLFLDEIGNLSPMAQAKLLVVLQNRSVTRLGATAATPVDVRVVSATNADLTRAVAAGAFRQDLLYRLRTVEILLPPLRHRPEDIEPLAKHFLAMYAARYHRNIRDISASGLRLLQSYAWAGNVRELQHCVERAVIFCESEQLQPADFDLQPTTLPSPNTTAGTLDSVERESVIAALGRAQGNISRAAAELGISRAALYRRMEKYGLA